MLLLDLCYSENNPEVGIGFTNRLAAVMYTEKSAESRRIVLIDIENVVGGGVSMSEQVRAAQTAIARVVVPREDDQVVPACGRFSVDVVGFEWRGPRRLVFRTGTNGADLELLDILETERVGDRFTEIVLVSGDGIFAEIVSLLGLHAEVTVASRAESCSRSLRMAAKRVLHIDYDPNAIEEAA